MPGLVTQGPSGLRIEQGTRTCQDLRRQRVGRLHLLEVMADFFYDQLAGAGHRSSHGSRDCTLGPPPAGDALPVQAPAPPE